MRKLSKPTVAVLAGLGAIALSVGPSYASAGHGTPSAETPVQLAHSSNRGQPSQGQQGQGMMNQGQQGQQGQGMMNPGQQGQGNMNPGQQGQGMMNPGQQGQGNMNPGQQGQGMMNPGQQGQGMMGGGMMNMMRQHMMGQGQGMMGSNSGMGMGFGGQVVVNKDLTVDDVSHFLGHRLEIQGNERLTLGDVVEVDGDKITADINTVDGSLVQRLEIDLHSGKMQHMQQNN